MHPSTHTHTNENNENAILLLHCRIIQFRFVLDKCRYINFCHLCALENHVLKKDVYTAFLSYNFTSWKEKKHFQETSNGSTFSLQLFWPLHDVVTGKIILYTSAHTNGEKKQQKTRGLI